MIAARTRITAAGKCLKNVRSISSSALVMNKHMVFEGKLMEEPTTPTATTPAPVQPSPVPTQTSTPKKSHKFRNFTVTTLLLASIIGLGGAAYALEDDKFNSYYVDYLPFGAELVDFLEDLKYKYSLGGKSSTKTLEEIQKEIDNIRVGKSGITSIIVPVADAPEAKKQDATTATPSVSAQSSATKTSSVAAGLPLIRIPIDADPLIANSINALNSLITAVNESKQDRSNIADITKEIETIAVSVNELKKTHQEDLKNKKARLIEARSNELKLALASQKEKWTRDFRDEQQRLAAVYNERLFTEVTAATKSILAQANNFLLGAHISREKKFAEELEDKVSTNREQLLSKLKTLTSELGDIDTITNRTNEILEESDRATRLHIAIDGLKTALDTEQNVALKPFIDAIRKSAGEDPLLSAAIDSIPKSAYENGVLTRSQLSEKLEKAGPEITKASLLPPNAGILGHFSSLLFSKLLWKKEGNVSNGEDVESILSRANNALSEGNVSEAVTEINGLKGWPKKLAHDFLNEGRKRSEVEFLVDVLSEEGKLLK